jgi:hypothetical protein
MTPIHRMISWGPMVMALALVITPIVSSPPEEGKQLRSDVEANLGTIGAAYRAAPGDDGNRRAYADILFKLGNIWQANDVIAPLATAWSSNADDLLLGARAALLTLDCDRAEVLFKRLRDITDKGTEIHTKALKGLIMVYYQTNQYDKVKGIELPGEDETRGISTHLTFMKRFKGKPYEIEWATPDKVAHLPIINDFTPAGALPLMKLEVNGHPVEFILDTGGDMLYIDESVAEKAGIRHISKRQARYAYTGGKSVDEPLGVANTVKMGEVTLKNVPVVVAKWKVMGPTSDGVVTTQILKQFLSTVDYDKKEITLRERSETGRQQLLETFGSREPVRMPFWLTATHLMFTKGSINGRDGLDLFVDSGLASSMAMVILDETVEDLGIADKKVDIQGTKYYWVPLESHGIGNLTGGANQALGNVLVEKDSYWGQGFIFDALVSHQYLRHLGSWTIDFDTMTYYFPAEAKVRVQESIVKSESETAAGSEKVEVANLERYAGIYEVSPGVDLKISTEGGVLFLQAPGQQKVGLEAAGDHTFLIRLAGAKVVFEADDSGAIAALVLHQRGIETRAKKK